MTQENSTSTGCTWAKWLLPGDCESYEGIYASWSTERRAVTIYLTPPLVTLGAVCNILTIAVLRRDDTMVKTTSLLLQMLATADLINMIFILLLTSVSSSNLPGNVTYYKIYLSFYKPVQSIVLTASAWFEVLITLERYLAVCYPLHVNRFATVKRVRAAIVITWLVALLINILRYFDTFVLVGTPWMEDNWYVVFYFTLYNNPSYTISYKIIFRSVINTFLPFALLTYFTVRVLTTLREAHVEQMKLGNKVEETKARKITKKQRRTTATLVLIVIVFILLDLPMIVNFAVQLAQKYIQGYPYDVHLLFLVSMVAVVGHLVQDLAFFCLLVKSLLNFFIFCLTGKRYRQILRDACSRCATH